MSEVRGKGATTEQMTHAPSGSVFVWISHDLTYPRDLARKLKREDLMIVSPSWLESRKWAGLDLSGLVLDHACRLTEEQRHELSLAMPRVRRC